MTRRNNKEFWCRAGDFAGLLLVVVAYPWAGLSAQLPGESSAIPDLSGVWNRDGCMSNGVTCPWDVATLPLRARALGFREAFDEVLSPKYDCVPATVPSIIVDPFLFEIRQMEERVLIFYEHGDVVRTVWLRGHGHSELAIGDFFQQGHSVGWYENGQLVIETTRFTFDPHGLDDMADLPSSTQKKVIERYWRDQDMMRGDVVTEDPLFLTEPVLLSNVFRPSNESLTLPYDCDPELARQPLQFIPPKYIEPGFVRIPMTPHGQAPR